MPEAIGSRMGVETQVVNPFERIPVRPDAPMNLVLEEAGPMLLLSLGLALRVP
jgi:Tfp pilus assembly PilM family ATPase